MKVEQLQQEVDALEVSPAVKEQLLAALATYANLKFDVDLLAHQMDIEKMTIGKILEEQDIESLKLDEFSCKWHRGETVKTLDRTKLIAMGITPAQIEAATVETPKKEYFQILERKGKKS
jgi:hypothetical protein